MRPNIPAYLFVLYAGLSSPVTTPAEPTEPAPTASVASEAVSRAIIRIQHAQKIWQKKESCASCHHQMLPIRTFSLARKRGVPFDDKAAREMIRSTFAPLADLDMFVQGYNHIDTPQDALALTAAHLAGVKPNLSTTVLAQTIASYQRLDGSWTTFDARPPQAHSLFTQTALCAEAIQQYLPESLKTEKEKRVRKARNWLLNSMPRTTEDRAFQLLGLLWTGAEHSARQKAALQLLSEQRTDGGWSELPELPSDAYSTGEVLYALRESAGLDITHAAFQRGLRFLLGTQAQDGSWHVTSRLHPPGPVSPPYFDTEFPKGHDQFISIMATSWAANALLMVISADAHPAADPLEFPNEQPDGVRVALTGSAGELARLLDAGLDPNSQTTGGTTLLMLAARDARKVKLLLARGAQVNTQAPSGITALMVAAQYKGNSDSVRLLLQNGAKVNVEGKVRNDASALFFAAMSGDVKTAKLLLAAGAEREPRMKLLGQFTNTPVIIAATNDEVPMVRFLVEGGSRADEMDDDKITALGWAVLCNHPESARVLLKNGANVNHVDNYGMTPLLYAASVDFGDTAILETLLSAGADLDARDKQGRTALALVKAYNHKRAAALLTRLASK